MNILLINYEYPPIGGGAGNATHFMGQALAKLGHQTTILTAAWGKEEGLVKKGDVHVYRIPCWRKDASSASTLEKLHFVWKARSKLKEIAQTHNIEAAIVYFTIPCGPLGLKLFKDHQIPYVISLRGGDVPGLVPEIDWIHKLIQSQRRNILGHAKAIIANANGLADLSRKADPHPVGVIPNGVDTDFFKPNPDKKRDPDHTQFLFVGRFHPQKNLEYLLEHLAILKKESQKKFSLHLVGNGPLENTLKDLSQKLHLHENLIWHGWLDKASLQQLHQESDVFINPSHYEGLPNAVLEAMASGSTIIVSDVPGNKDLITEGAGYCYPHQNSEALLDSLRSAHKNTHPEYGPNARQRAVKNYSWEKVGAMYVDLFQKET